MNNWQQILVPSPLTFGFGTSTAAARAALLEPELAATPESEIGGAHVQLCSACYDDGEGRQLS